MPHDSEPDAYTYPVGLKVALDAGARHAVFTAKLDGLVPTDTNGVDDVFLYSIQHTNISTDIEFLNQLNSAAAAKTASESPDQIEYKVTVSNLSSEPAENVRLSVYFSMGSSPELYKDDKVMPSDSGPNYISHSLDTVPANSSLEFKLRVELPLYDNFYGDFSIESSVTAPGFDEDPIDNWESEVRKITISSSQSSSGSVGGGSGGGGCTLRFAKTAPIADISLLLLLGIFMGIRALSNVTRSIR